MLGAFAKHQCNYDCTASSLTHAALRQCAKPKENSVIKMIPVVNAKSTNVCIKRVSHKPQGASVRMPHLATHAPVPVLKREQLLAVIEEQDKYIATKLRTASATLRSVTDEMEFLSLNTPFQTDIVANAKMLLHADIYRPDQVFSECHGFLLKNLVPLGVQVANAKRDLRHAEKERETALALSNAKVQSLTKLENYVMGAVRGNQPLVSDITDAKFRAETLHKMAVPESLRDIKIPFPTGAQRLGEFPGTRSYAALERAPVYAVTNEYEYQFPALGRGLITRTPKISPELHPASARDKLAAMGFKFNNHPAKAAVYQMPMLCVVDEGEAGHSEDDVDEAIPSVVNVVHNEAQSQGAAGDTVVAGGAAIAANAPVGHVPNIPTLDADPFPSAPGQKPVQQPGTTKEAFDTLTKEWNEEYFRYNVACQAWRLRQDFRESRNKVSTFDHRAIALIKPLGSGHKPVAVAEWLKATKANLESRGVTNQHRQVQLAAGYLEAKIANRWQLAVSKRVNPTEPLTWGFFKKTLLTSSDGKDPAHVAREEFLAFQWNSKSTDLANLHQFQKLYDVLETTIPGTSVAMPDGYQIKELFVQRVLAACPLTVRITVAAQHQAALSQLESQGWFISASKFDKAHWYSQAMETMLASAVELVKTYVNVQDAQPVRNGSQQQSAPANGKEWKMAKGAGPSQKRKGESSNSKPDKRAKDGKSYTGSGKSFKDFLAMLPNKGVNVSLLHTGGKRCVYCGMTNHGGKDCKANLAAKFKDDPSRAAACTAARDLSKSFFSE